MKKRRAVKRTLKNRVAKPKHKSLPNNTTVPAMTDVLNAIPAAHAPTPTDAVVANALAAW